MTSDARSYSHQTLEEIRIDAVRRVEAGERPEDVIAGLGMNRRTIYPWLTAYHYGGEDSLLANPIAGAPPKLGEKQMAKLAKIIREKNPLQLNIVQATGARFSLNMRSAVNAQGMFRFMTVGGSVNATVFREFLKRLITGMTRKIFLIVDCHPMHNAKLVQKFVQENSDAIELFFLPPYALELNPDELAWAHIKTRVAKATAQTTQELKASVERVMHRLQNLPDIVAGCLGTQTCAYARACGFTNDRLN
jgi:transposase